MKGDQIELGLPAECFNGPILLPRCDFNITQHGTNINRLAVVTTAIFAKSFHAENFMQERQDANGF